MPRALPTPPEGIGAFQTYRGSEGALPFTFEYPGNWLVGENRGHAEPYAQVSLLGPRNALDTYSAGLLVRAIPTAAAGGRYADAKELVEWRRSQYAKQAGFTVLQEDAARSLGSWVGHDLELRFTSALPVGSSLERTETTLQLRIIIVADGDRFYELAYSADAEDYSRYEPAFTRLLETLRPIPR